MHQALMLAIALFLIPKEKTKLIVHTDVLRLPKIHFRGTNPITTPKN